MISKAKFASLFLVIFIIDFSLATFSQVPPEPRPTAPLLTREDLKRYLQKVHEYHSILGRWRLRRDHVKHVLSNLYNNDVVTGGDTKNDYLEKDSKPRQY